MVYKKYFPLLSSILFLFSFLQKTYAQDYVPLETIPGIEGGGITLPLYLNSLFNIGIAFAGVLAVIVLVIAGIEYIGGAASESARKDAKDRITGAILGLLIALGAWVILSTISDDLVSGTLNIAPTGSSIFGTPSTNDVNNVVAEELRLTQKIQDIDTTLAELNSLPSLTPEQEALKSSLLTLKQETEGDLAGVSATKDTYRTQIEESLRCKHYFERQWVWCSGDGYKVGDTYCESSDTVGNICCADRADGCDNTPA